MSAPAFRRYLLSLCGAVASLLLVDLLIERFGLAIPELQLSPAVWGTYGDWAGAILPTFALLVTVDMWLRDRRARDRAVSDALVAGVALEERAKQAVWFVNNSLKAVDIVEETRNGVTVYAPMRVASHADGRRVGEVGENPIVKVQSADGTVWVVTLNANPRRAGGVSGS